jgi:hypothetical protein
MEARRKPSVKFVLVVRRLDSMFDKAMKHFK